MYLFRAGGVRDNVVSDDVTITHHYLVM